MADTLSPIVFELPPLSMPLEKAAERLGVSRPKLEQIIKAGLLRCHTLQSGGERRVSYMELVRYVEAREAEGVR